MLAVHSRRSRAPARLGFVVGSRSLVGFRGLMRARAPRRMHPGPSRLTSGVRSAHGGTPSCEQEPEVAQPRPGHPQSLYLRVRVSDDGRVAACGLCVSPRRGQGSRQAPELSDQQSQAGSRRARVCRAALDGGKRGGCEAGASGEGRGLRRARQSVACGRAQAGIIFEPPCGLTRAAARSSSRLAVRFALGFALVLVPGALVVWLVVR